MAVTGQRVTLRQVAKLGARWLALTCVALGLTLLWLLRDLHPTGEHLRDIALALIPGGVISLAAGGIAWWLLTGLQVGGLRLKLALPAVLAALIMGINAWFAARLMFISVIDAQVLVGFLVFGVGVALVLSSSLAAALAGGLRRLTWGAQRIAAGDYHARLPETAAALGELNALAHTFNAMAVSVQRAFAQRDAAEEQRRMLLAALSHDVRTPLASMRAMLEAIDDGVVSDPATIHRYHSAIRGEIRHLGALIDDLFEIANMEAGTLQLQREELNLVDLLSDAIEAAHEEAERAGVRLIGHVAGELPTIRGDARQIYRVIRNLLQNALQHTLAEGVILVEARVEGRVILVRVLDSGEGIAAHDLPHIFTPAYRGERSRRRAGHQGGGTGLGLAIARGVIVAHGGTIAAESPLAPADRALMLAQMSPDAFRRAGTCVHCTLPINEIAAGVADANDDHHSGAE